MRNPLRILQSFNSLQCRQGLEFCPKCGKDFVYPIDWEPISHWWWKMLLRCGECGREREVPVNNSQADRFDDALDRHQTSMRRDLIKLRADMSEEDASIMAHWADTMAEAIRLGLVDAGDFAC